MTSEMRKQIYAAGKLLKMTSDKITDSNKMVETLATILTYNAFSARRDRIPEPAFTKKRCDPPMTKDQIKDATTRSEAAVKKVRQIEADADAIQTTSKVPVTDEDKAITFLSGDPMGKIREQYAHLHYGDEDALHCVIWGYCVKWVKVAYDEGIHIIAVGLRGTGKSHGITSAMQFLPPELTWIKGISARYLYYAENLVCGLTVYLDELPSEQPLIDALKAIISAYPNGSSRGTVHDGKAIEQKIPPRITINTSSVEQKSDEQFTNRMTVIRASPDQAKRNARVDFRLRLYAGQEPSIDHEELMRIHNALRYISTKKFTVIVPEKAITFDPTAEIDIRVLNQFICAICGNAILNFPKRSPKPDAKSKDVSIVVTKEDFDAVIHLYQDPDEYLLKLTDAAKRIKNHLEKMYPQYSSIGDIADAVGLSAQTVRTSIKGRHDRNTESLINAGYVEEVSLTDQEGEKGPRTTSHVYRATRKSEGNLPGKKKRTDTGQGSIGDFIPMVSWDTDHGSSTNQQTTANQSMVCTKPPLCNTTTNQTNQIIREGV